MTLSRRQLLQSLGTASLATPALADEVIARKGRIK
jgi:hypothetical protein